MSSIHKFALLAVAFYMETLSVIASESHSYSRHYMGTFACNYPSHGSHCHKTFFPPKAATDPSGSRLYRNPPNNLPMTKVHPRRHSLAPLFSSSSDAVIDQSTNSSDSAHDKAQQLRERARALRLEATAAEQILRNATQQKKDIAKKEADEWIDTLLGANAPSVASETSGKGVAVSSNNNIPAVQTLALRIRENQLFSASKLQNIVERLHERETAMVMGPEGYLSKQETTIDGGEGGGGFMLGDYENNSMEYKREETGRISGLLNRILEAVQVLDEEGSTNLGSKLRVRVSDLRQSRDALLQRRINNLSNNSLGSRPGSKDDRSIDGYAKSSIDGDGDGDENKDGKRSKEDKMLERLLERPSWLPSSLAAFAATSPVEVSVSHWKLIKTDLLADSAFVCTSWDATDVAAVFRGSLPRASLRSSSPEKEINEEQSENSITAVFEDLQSRLENHTELNDRVRLFLVNDNEWSPSFDNGGNYGSRLGGWDNIDKGPPPVIIALAKEVEPEQESERGITTKSLAAFSTLLTIFTTLAYALSSFALNPTFCNAVVKENDITAALLCLPVFFGVLALSALHEVGHIVAAKKHRVKLGLPVPLPSLQVGTFGSITPLRSFPSTRAALFDVAISGPGISMLVSIILITSGLSLTMSAQSLASFPVVPAAMMKSSFLIGSIVSIVAPKMMLVPLSQPMPIHPLFLVGLAGLFVSAINLLPIGRLDGGRACMAAWGRQVASSASFLSLILLVLCSFSGVSGILMFWGGTVVLTQRLPDIPAVDEVTRVGKLRENSYIVLLALALLAFVPFPGGVGPI
ncbi:hypothetical protein ACHAXR_006475 [Thalassiosira sp. AJA248-18]